MARRIRLPRIPLGRIIRGRMLPWGVAVLAAAAAVTFALLWRAERADDARRDEVAEAATRFLRALTNFSADTIERDVEEIRSFAVGQFSDEVEETFGSEQVEAIRQSEASSTGEVRSVFVQELEGDTATVFGVVDETITNAASPAPREEVLRVEAEMIETAEGWRVAAVEVLQSPGQGLVDG